jgi:hypothetical protein
MRSSKRLAPVDRSGRRIRPGARVRVVGIPNLRGMGHSQRLDTEAVFRHIFRTYRRVTGFDSRGYAELTFRIRRGKYKGLHIVGIEPSLLLVPHAAPSNNRWRGP